jgi:hypothetical protein
MYSEDRCRMADAEMTIGEPIAQDGDLRCPVINLFCKTLEIMTNRDNSEQFSPANSLDPNYTRDVLINPSPIP